MLLGHCKHLLNLNNLTKPTSLSLEAAGHKLQIAELAGALADAKIALVEFQDTIRAKDEEITSLKEAQKFSSEN